MGSRSDKEKQYLPGRADDIYGRSNLTKRQLLLWMAQRLNPEVPIYSVIETFTIAGEIEPVHFQKAFQALIDRSDALRTVIKEADGIPQQSVVSHFPYCVDYLEFSDKSDPQQVFQQWLDQRSLITFSLEERLFDSALVRVSENQYVWYLNLHQIITDCWSTSLIYRRVADFYEHSLEGKLAEIPALPSFQDYVKYERAYRRSDAAKKAEVYWQRKLAKSFKPTSFYGRAPREETTHMRRIIQELGRGRSQKLKAIATQKDVRSLTWDVSLFNIFATIVFTYLYRVSGNRRLAIGTPFQNRPTGIFKETIGLFVEVCPLQIEIAQEDTFLSLLKKVMKETQEVLFYAQYSIGNPEHNRLYDVMLNYANWAFPDFCGFPTQNRQVHDYSEDRLFIQVNDLESSDGFVLWFDFNRDIFDEVQCSRAIQHFLSVVDAFLSDKTQRISEVDLLSEQEGERASVEWNATEAEKFVANPLSEDPQTRLHKTGDLDRYLPNGGVQNLDRLDHQEADVAPRTPLEHFLAKMWQDVLGIERIGIYDNFFELGGDSLKAAKFVTNLQQELGQTVYIVAVADAPNIADMASYLQQHYPDATSSWFTRRSDQSTTAGTTEKVEARIGSREIARFRRLIPSQRAEQGEDTASKNPPAIFVLSPPRSGSTLFRAMLAGHPRLFAPPELELLSFETLEDRKLAFAARYSFWLEGTVRAIMEIKGCSAAAAKSIMDDCEARKLSTRQMYRMLQEWIGDRVLVDKTPSYALDQRILKRAETDFESPLYVHLLRHPCAMIRSFEQAKTDQVFFRYPHGFSVRQLAELIWLISQENIIEFLRQIPSSRQIQIKFEDLVKEPRRIMEQFCQFQGLEYHADLLRPYDSKEKRMTDGIYSVSKMLGDPKFHDHRNIDPRVSDQWKDHYADDFLGDNTWELAKRLGYERPEDTRVGRKPSQGTAVSARWPVTGPRALVVPLQPNGAKPPFFFLAGRSHFGDRLGPDQPVYRVVYQDLDREQPLVRAEDMAAHSIKGIRTIQPDGPYYLGGHGLGGTVAFEVAHQLQRQGQKVALLVLCESWAPGAKRPAPGTSSAYRLWQRASYYFDRARRIGARQALADLLGVLKQKTERVAWRPRTRSPQGHRAAAFKAVSQYVPQTYSGRITVVRCTERVPWKHDDPLRGWGHLATDGVDAYEVPGGHASIYREPNVGMLASTLNDVLHKAQARAQRQRTALVDLGVSAESITSADVSAL